ncbi:MAG: flagella assembly protein FlgT middle domain-containing protein [Formivibrio sp.]|nr:flagella assembly protein FlgT middle domain-containing protein [Formivibrio sp.]
MCNFTLRSMALAGLVALMVGYSSTVVSSEPAVTVTPLAESGIPPVATAPAAVSTCGADYRRKVLVTSMPVLSPVQIADLPRFPEVLQAELARRLEAEGHFLPQQSNNEAAYSEQPHQNETQWNPEWIRDLARRYGVQYVVGGELRDAGFEGERYVLSHGNDIRPGERKQELNLPLLNFFKPGLKATPAARRLEMDLLVFDGISGAQIGRHRFAGKAEGQVLFGAEVVFDPTVAMGSQRFFDSDFGKLVDAKLNDAVDNLYHDIQCIPFTARVARVEPGRIYVDAGGTSKLAVGTRLQVYRLRPGARGVDASGQRGQLGWPEEFIGTLLIREVQPLFSRGEAEGALRVEVGDYVRFAGSAEKY